MSFGRALARRRLGTRSRRGTYRFRSLRARVPARRLRLILAVALGAGVILLGGWVWLRDSSLVAVRRVTVTGAAGPDGAAIRSALVSAARNMTTLNVSMGQLRTAVKPYPEVKSLRVSTGFPHAMRIAVIEQLAVGAVDVGGRRVAVAVDGTLLHDVAAGSALPLIPLAVPPGGPKLTEPGAVGAVAVLAAAPWRLLAKLSQVTTVAGHGLVAQLRNGPSIYFGDPSQLRAKWTAATEVLASSGSTGATYIDVTDPARPAAGAGGSTTATTTTTTAPTAPTTTTTSTSGG